MSLNSKFETNIDIKKQNFDQKLTTSYIRNETIRMFNNKTMNKKNKKN